MPDKQLGTLILSVAGTIFLLLALLIFLLRPSTQTESRQWSSVTTVAKHPTKSAGNRSVATASAGSVPTRNDLRSLATAQYDQTLRALQVSLIEDLNQIIRQTRDSYYLPAERDAFINRGILPVLPAAQPAVRRYLAGVAEADRKLKTDLDKLK